MGKDDKLLLGIDVGSVSVDIALLDDNNDVVEEQYIRHTGRPMRAVRAVLGDLLAKIPVERIGLVATTGTGGKLLADLLDAEEVNEVVAQAKATAVLYPDVRTVIEIGGEDSKLIFMERKGDAEPTMADFNMNTMCAAGTGSFLDQQATRLGVSIEEFGEMSLKSERPPRLAGRCSVFAKSDMIHLQQKATPTEDIIAGLAFAMARNFKSTVGSARNFEQPIAFQGGVAANRGMIRAFESVLDLEPGSLIVPKHFSCMGAIGAVLHLKTAGRGKPFTNLAKLDAFLAESGDVQLTTQLKPLQMTSAKAAYSVEGAPPLPTNGDRIPAYLGVDIGSISTNVVVIDKYRRVLSKRYLMTAGRPIEAVRQGLREVGAEIAHLVDIRGACTTGSGRYLIADFIGADVVKNEITAQARGAIEIDPKVDTIFEIGGQDSKYISLDNGAIADFEMNKVCAAGTGSFLEEQAEKLGISIKGEFGKLALQSNRPAMLGERCTVFMESELVRQQQAGAPTEDLVAGLSYSIVLNYLNRVVAGRKVGERIFFQGGTAANQGIVSAFEAVLGKAITVPEHHEVTGAIGCALIAMEHDNEKGSRFKGFDLSERKYEVSAFECKECANRCEINRVTVEGERPRFYGSRCEKYDVERKKGGGEGLPDYFAERERLLTESYVPPPLPAGAKRVGFPRALLYHEIFPLWQAFFGELGIEIVLSDATTKSIIHQGCALSVAETCFPVKVGLGHVANLLDKEIDYLFLPSVVNMPRQYEEFTDTFVCPYVQSFTYTMKAALDTSRNGIQELHPVIWLQHGSKQMAKSMREVGRQMGKKPAEIRNATKAAMAAQVRFWDACQERGREILKNLRSDEQMLVIVSR